MIDDTLVVKAYAKVNWTLDVFQRRSDGYHEVASIMQQIDLADILTFSVVKAGITLAVTGPERTGVPEDQTNIVYRAASLLGADGVAITVEKNIPSQAGLGGGSSDAAATLLAINTMLQLSLTRENLLAVARQLGADVSFFLGGDCAKVEGFGDKITAIERVPATEIVLVKPQGGVSTAQAYAALGSLANRISHNATVGWPSTLPSNDFEAVIYPLYPHVAAARDALLKAGASRTLLCGSGAAVMGWGGQMPAVAAKMKQLGFRDIWLSRTI